jgi:hypothetical protein
MVMDHDPLDPKKMTAELLRRMCINERKRALDGHWTYDLARHRSYLNELHRRQRAMCSYYLTTEAETRP